MRHQALGVTQRFAMCTGNHALMRPIRLTPCEFRTLRLAAHGTMTKHIADELGMHHAAARGALRRSLQKLGLESGAQLPALWLALGAPAARVEIGAQQTLFVFECELSARGSVHLTAAEQAILTSILCGQGNRVISQQRGTSERTIANQVSSLLRKFGVASRRELNAMLLRSESGNGAELKASSPATEQIGAGAPR